MHYQVREMTKEDIPVIVRQEEEIFQTSLGYDMLYSELDLNPYAYYFVLEIDGDVEGYIGIWIVENNAEIINFYITKEFQNQGFGSMILNFIVELCELSNVSQLSLEVRTSNEKAKRLYQKFGFCFSHIRKNYYSDGEDAIVMVRKFEVGQ